MGDLFLPTIHVNHCLLLFKLNDNSILRNTRHIKILAVKVAVKEAVHCSFFLRQNHQKARLAGLLMKMVFSLPFTKYVRGYGVPFLESLHTVGAVTAVIFVGN